MSKHSIHDQALALAGIFQAASLVSQIANKGMANSAVIEASIESLFRFDAASVEQVYGDLAGVSHGLRILKAQLSGGRSVRDMDVTKYVIALIALEKKLSRNEKMLSRIAGELKQIESQLDFFNLSDNAIFSKLGELYKNTISTLGPKIVISGERPYLGNETNASKVRALLLAGIRSAVLWRQCGGSRWQFLFKRKAYLEQCESILRRL